MEKMTALDLGNGAMMYSRCLTAEGEATAALMGTSSRDVTWGHLEDNVFFAHGGVTKQLQRQAQALCAARPAAVV